jgi:hypothetical protein
VFRVVCRQTVSYYLGNSLPWIVRPAGRAWIEFSAPVTQNRPIAASGSEFVLENAALFTDFQWVTFHSGHIVGSGQVL